MKEGSEYSTRYVDRLAVWLATGLGVGFVPVAPGTVGAIWGLPLAWAIGVVGQTSVSLQVVAIVVICAASIPVCTRAVRAMGGKKDPGAIVLDEIASLPITFFLVEMNTAIVVVAGFALHRLFDITKPPPARQFERLEFLAGRIGEAERERGGAGDR